MREAVWLLRTEIVVWVAMSITLDVWSPEAVAMRESSWEKHMSIMALE